MLVFLCKLLDARSDEPLSVLNRTMIFEGLRAHEIGVDTPIVLACLSRLTDRGNDIEFLEAHIAQFLLDVMPACLKFECMGAFLSLLQGVLRKHSMVIDPQSLNHLMICVCHTSSASDIEEIVRGCLAVIRVFIDVGAVSPDLLQPILAALCHAAIVDHFNTICIDTVQELINTNRELGFAVRPSRLFKLMLPAPLLAQALTICAYQNLTLTLTLTHAGSLRSQSFAKPCGRL